MTPLHSQFIPAAAPIMPGALPPGRKRPSYGAPEKVLPEPERKLRAARWRREHAEAPAMSCAEAWPPMDLSDPFSGNQQA